MSVSTLVLNAAYVALLASTFTRTLTWLRVMLVAASIAFIVFGAVEAIWSMLVWNIAIGSMHLWRIVRDIRQQRSVTLSAEDQVMRDEFFPGLADFDFHLLWCMGDHVELANEVVIHKGTLPETVSLVLAGTVAIEQNDHVDRGVGRGGLLGEMSFVSGQPAGVNVTAQGNVTLRQWNQDQLASLDHVHPPAARAFRQLISRDLVAKAST